MSEVKVEIFILCDYATISQDGKLNIMGIFDFIGVQNIPSNHSRAFVVVVLSGKPNSDHKLVFEIKSPSGKSVLAPKEMVVQLGSNGRNNTIIDVAGLPISEIGVHKVTITEDKKTLGITTFDAIKVSSMTQSSSKLVN